MVMAQNQRIITWDSVGQRYRIKNYENIDESWRLQRTSNHYIFYRSRPDGYELELRTMRNVDTSIRFSLVRSVALRNDIGSSPVTDTVENPRAQKTLKFRKIGDANEIRFGEVANVQVISDSPSMIAYSTYFSFESVPGGYRMELTDINSIKTLRFDCMCKTFVVQSPRMADVAIDPTIRYEQLIWTPRKDGTWEARIGTDQRGCKSPALDGLNALRTSVYERDRKTCK